MNGFVLTASVFAATQNDSDWPTAGFEAANYIAGYTGSQLGALNRY